MSGRVLIIGGGPAGMMAALFAAKSGASVTLAERNEKLGKKLYITGKGRCNVTNDAEKDPFMRNILRNPRFMFAAFSLVDNFGTMDLLEQLGVPLKVERGGRVFPESDHASDVTRALERALRAEKVEILLNARVQSLLIEENCARGVVLENGRTLAADAVVLATGGLSYPATGSSGDGHRFAEAAGHAIMPLLPALTPIVTVETWPRDVMGISLKNVRLLAYQGEKRIYSEMGEMLFTHYGISGPLALTLSSLLPEDASGIRLLIDLKPALDDGTLDRRLLRDIDEMKNRRLIALVDGLMPHNLAVKLIELCGLSPNMPLNSLTQEQRKTLRTMIKNVPLTVNRLRGFDEAIITRGGVSVKDINPSTMASRHIGGLFFAGEMMDVDALTGGFNMQIAFSSGALAGKSAASAARGAK